MQTRNALGNLMNRYKAVLAKCNILNSLATLALASCLSTGLLLNPILINDAHAEVANPNGTTITSGGFVASPSDPTLTNNGTITGGHYFFDPVFNAGSYVGMYGSHSTGSIDYCNSKRRNSYC